MINRYQRIAATVGKNIYQEQLETIGQVSIPHSTAKALIESDIPTPNVPQKEVQFGIPTFMETGIIETIGKFGGGLMGSREDWVSGVTSLLPFDVKITTTTPPEYNATITDVPQKLDMNLFKGKIINVPQAVLPKEVVNNVFQVTPTDYPVTQDTVAINKYFQDLIDLQKSQNEEYRKFWESNQFGLPVISFPDINIPEFPNPFGDMFKDWGKWLLIGGVAIAGIYLIGKALGGKGGSSPNIILGGK